MPLSVSNLAELKSRAERDAKAYLQELLALRKQGTDGFTQKGAAVRGRFLETALQSFACKAPDTESLIESFRFYTAEFDRNAASLMDVLMAASGKGASAHD